jgi:hypothetical protein
VKYRIYNSANDVVFKAASYAALMRQVEKVWQLGGFIPTGCQVVSPTRIGKLDEQFQNWLRYKQYPKQRRKSTDEHEVCFELEGGEIFNPNKPW